MKRLATTIAVGSLVLIAAACNLPLAGDPHASCFRYDGFLGESVIQVSCAGPHDFTSATPSGR